VDEVRREDPPFGSTHVAGEEAHEQPPEEGETVGRHRASEPQPDAAFLASEE
jgi:hypothetical protein